MGVYMFVGGLALFVLGMEFMCLISGFVTKYEAFKAKAEDRMRKLETSIQEMKSEMRALSAKADRALIEKPFAEASFRGKHESKKGGVCNWVESNPVPQPYGTILTEILNFDAAPYQAVMDRLDDVIKHKNSKEAPRAYLDMLSVSAELPLYRLYATDFQTLKDIPVEMLVVGEAREAFEEDVIERKSDTPVSVQKQLDDIRFIQERYAWFLDSMFKGVSFEKKKGQRKESPAKQVYLHNLGAFVSGVSLGDDPKVDAPQVKTQYRIRGEVQGECEIVEKMYFNGLLDFVYVELMKGLQKGFAPKRCANCRRWFLQTPGATYSYCNEPAPGQGGKTCREIGAAKSFKEKVDNNDIWKVHQRAYKKYFARVSKGKMSKPEFEVWAREAERMRDEALTEDEMAKDKAAHEQIVRRLTEELNRERNCKPCKLDLSPKRNRQPLATAACCEI